MEFCQADGAVWIDASIGCQGLSVALETPLCVATCFWPEFLSNVKCERNILPLGLLAYIFCFFFIISISWDDLESAILKSRRRVALKTFANKHIYFSPSYFKEYEKLARLPN